MARRLYLSTDQFAATCDGLPLEDLLWADAGVDEAEIYEHDWALDRRGQRVPDLSCPNGYRTLIMRGDIRILEPPREQAALPSAENWDAWRQGMPS